MRYIALLYGEPDAGPAPGTPEFMEMLGEFQSATAAMADAGILVDSGPLQPSQTAITVRVRNGETLLSDGPFAEIGQPHRPGADPASPNASGRSAGVGGQVQPAVHSSRPHHRSH